MSKTIVVEGKTSTEAIQNGLKQLQATKEMVEIKILESEEKKSFFSILAPRVVKVELTLKEDKVEVKPEHVEEKRERKERIFDTNQEDLIQAKQRVETFLEELVKNMEEEIHFSVEIEDTTVSAKINGENINYLIGYRGETLNAMQIVVSSIANKGLEQRCKILVDVEGYRAKREKTLEELAGKIARTVIRTKKSVTLEPMSAYERKIIHSRLQDHRQVKTYSTGEEPYRKVVVALK